MPYKNPRQYFAMHKKAPDVARRWDRLYGPPKGLAEHVEKVQAPVRRPTGALQELAAKDHPALKRAPEKRLRRRR